MLINKISIIIPCYNEEATISSLLDAVIASDVSYEKEIIVIDDCSTDQSADAISQYPDINYLHHQTNQGSQSPI